MRKYLKALLCSVALTAAVPTLPAHATDTFYAEHQGWDIYASDRFNGCYMLKQWDRGTQFYLAYDISDNTFVMRIANANWRNPIKQSAPYPIRMVFDDGSTWTGTFIGMSTERDIPAVILLGLKLDFVRAFMMRNSVALYTANGTFMTNIALNGSAVGMAQTVQCADRNADVPRSNRPSASKPREFQS
jgi:hypothetical protein